MYVGISKNVLMYLTKGKYNLLSEVLKEDSRYYRFFTINKTGKDIVMAINGRSTVDELESKFCKKMGISLRENEEWLDEFILMLMKKETIILSNEPIEQEKLKITGDGKLISPMMATIDIWMHHVRKQI